MVDRKVLFMKKIIVFLTALLAISTPLHAAEVDRGLCYVPKYKETFVSEKEKTFYYRSIERTQRCVEHIVKSNDEKIAELQRQINDLELEKDSTQKKWNVFVSKLKKG